LSRGKAMRQKTTQMELPLENRGEAPKRERSGEAGRAARGRARSGVGHEHLMELVVGRENRRKALKRVRQNKGSAGVDGMTVGELGTYLGEHWPEIREQLLAGTYQPMPVRRHVIRKSGGGFRELGIPTVLDRFIQQCGLQVLQPIFDPTFSEHSHGFRPGRRAHDAVREAQRYIQEGRRWVVDVDLEKFFDRVNHDVLMGKLENRFGDRRLHRIIRRYLQAGVMAHGVVVERYEGTPQGGPLSPLLANVLWDEVDKGSWNDAGTRSCATPMTVMCTCGRNERARVSWKPFEVSMRSSDSGSTKTRARWHGYGAVRSWATGFGWPRDGWSNSVSEPRP